MSRSAKLSTLYMGMRLDILGRFRRFRTRMSGGLTAIEEVSDDELREKQDIWYFTADTQENIGIPTSAFWARPPSSSENT